MLERLLFVQGVALLVEWDKDEDGSVRAVMYDRPETERYAASLAASLHVPVQSASQPPQEASG
jgi:hypothetical protein